VLLVAVVAALPLVWLTVRVSDRGDESAVIDQAPGGEHGGPVAGEPLPATRTRHVQTVAFDADGQPTPGSVSLPADLAITAGRVRILDSSGGRIVTIAPDGELVPIQQGRGVDGTSLKGSPAMAALGERLFVVSLNGSRIVVIDESGLIEGSLVPSLPPGQAPASIAGIAVSHSGTIWLSDAANHRVIRLSSHGEFELIIGEGAPSSSERGFNTPSGVAVDEDGNLYVSDSGNGLVKKYSLLGVPLEVIGEGDLVSPQGVAVTAEGRIFVADSGTHGVSVFGPSGAYIGSIRDSAFQEPHVIRMFGEDLYVLDTLAGMMVFRAPVSREGLP
jgi:sugar lactone lactonase YvrE